jgi:hypothetical protein
MKKKLEMVVWHVPDISELRQLWQEDLEFKASLGYTGSEILS